MKFDKEIVASKYKFSREFHVDYDLYKRKSGAKIHIPKVRLTDVEKCSGYCFGSLLSQLDGAKYNRLAYKPVFETKNKRNVLNKTDIKRWYKIAIENKLLPDYVSPSHFDKTFVLDLENISPSLLFVYLCTIRNVEEEPDFVRSVVHLVDQRGMAMFAAIVLVTKLTFNKSLHHYMSFGKYYGTELNINRVRMELKFMISLKRYLKEPRKDDKRKPSSQTRFNAYQTIEGISKIEFKVGAKDVFNEHILAAINSNTDAAANKHIELFKKETGCGK